ncbi:MAG: AAA-like domain-containing protein, partial [Prochloraceae cyanobacterium]
MLIEPTSAYNYQVGGSLSPYAPTYVMRQADRELYASIKESEFCYVLTPRQTGKSSLMLRTMLKLQQEDIACAAIDLTVLGGRDVNERQWYTAFVFELNNDFQLLNYSSLSDWLRKHELLSPVTLLREFVEQVILKQLDDKIVIFIDEIDSILGLPFENKYFFTWIRNCFNLRASKPEYQRLTFVMLGVATPSDLIQDKNVTPFNIGHAIHIEGIQVNEVWPLAKGLADICAAPHALLEEILVWTGGQPFLTQKLCKLAHYELSQSFNKQTDNHFSSANGVSRAQITRWVEDLVQRQVLEDWESKDEPTHLKTIRDRLLRNEKRAGRLLALYCQILAQGEVPVNNSIAQMELLLSGLVVKSLVSKQHSGPVLQSSNRIYAAVFDRCWVERELTELRPYAEAINAWLQSNCRDESRLLRGQALQSAMLWAKDKNLGDWDYRFLTASQAWDKSEVQRQLDAQKVANRILNAARRRAKWIYITCISAALLVIAFGIGTLRFFQQELEVAERGLRIEQQGFDILRKFESADLQALHFAMVL